jgi:hypothetical protein
VLLLVLQVVINDRVVRSLSLVNPGRVNFDFTWDLGNHPRLLVKPAGGSVPKGERRVIELSYAPTAPEQLAGYRIKCQVRQMSFWCTNVTPFVEVSPALYCCVVPVLGSDS